MADKKSTPRLRVMELAGIISGLAGIVLLRLLSRPKPPRQAGLAVETQNPVPVETQNFASLRPGWHALPPEPLPRPTYWPAVMALGIVFVLWGIATTLLVSGVGFVLFVIALGGWIGEMIRED